MATRREILAAAIAAPMIVVPTAASATSLVCIPAAEASAWDAAFARYQAAKEADQTFEDEVYRPEMEPLEHLAPPYRIEHVAGDGRSATYVIVPHLRDYDTSTLGEWHFLKAETEAAKAKCEAFFAAMPPARYHWIFEHGDALGAAAHQARWDLFNTPAPHFDAVEWKLQMLLENASESTIEPPEMELIISDVRRVFGEA